MAKSIKKSGKNKNKKRSKLDKFSPKKVFIFGLLFLLFFTIFVFITSGNEVRYTEFKRVSNGRIEMVVPSEFSETIRSADIIDFEHKSSSSKSLSHLRIEAQYIGEKDLMSTKKVILDQLKAGEGDFYNVFKKKAASGPIANELSFGKFTDFNSRGSQDSIAAEFSYNYNGQIVLGKLLITFDDDSMYFVALEATEQIWSDNQKAWDNMLASLKLT